ncbi:MFS transporter [Hymenobacter sp. BT559]|uniref:MFS transporter n=1 Tax=Hymenobacter sp. BT559 TaxID=2795729 RepID=UPI0018EB1A2E|nr:MFS transporter [Hymenobacter sp. BT559]MBJ6144675.1 MFS transporter [Hymenobacter sp. BT559]
MNTSTFRALRSRNFRLYFTGQALSLLGTWMQKTAVSWVIYAQTNSKFMLGLSVFATMFPSAAFTLVGGGVADRYNRYRVLLTTQVLSMVQAALLTLLVFGRPGAVWGILGLSVVLGIINGFDVPARQSLVHELVEDKQDLPNALALNSSMVNLSKLIGPAVAGLAIEALGATTCFALNTLSFVAVIGSLLAIKRPAYVAKPHAKNILGELKEGFQYVRTTPDIRYIILMLAAVSLLVLPFTTLMPVYAKDIFHGTATTFGLIDSSIGLGAFIGALYLASRPPGTNLHRILATNTLIFGVGLILFSHTPWYPLALAFIAVGAFGMMSQITISNTLLQTTADPAMRGRVISFYVLAYTGMVPLGSLLVGVAAQHIGVQNTVLVQGVLALGLGALHWRSLHQQPAVRTELPAQANSTQGLALSS